MRAMTVKSSSGETMHVRNYNSIQELMDNVKPEDIQSYINSSPEKFIGRSFAGAKDVVNAFKSKWKEGVEFYTSVQDELSREPLPPPVDIRRRPEWMDTGDEYDLDRARSGQDAWRGMRRRATTNSTQVTLVIAYGARDASVKSKDMMWTTIAAVALADMLEANGYQVRVIGANRGSGRFHSVDHLTLVSTCLKEAGEPVVVDTMINALSGWFYRTMMWAEYENGVAQAKSKISPGLGNTIPVSGEKPEYIDEQYKGGHFIVVPIVYRRDMAMPMMRLTIEKINELMSL